MIQRDDLRNLVAEFFETEPDRIDADFSFTGARMEGSIARYALDAAIRRRLGIKCPAVHTAKTYGELESSLLGTAAPVQSPDAKGPTTTPSRRTAPELSAAFTNLGCGIDIELIANLPETTDYWQHEFYQTWFTPAEIAYCSMQPNPAGHFVARWCAKEALKKCDRQFLEAEMSQIEVMRDESGEVALAHRINGSVTMLPYALSISHTPLIAAAIVVRATGKPPTNND